MKQKQGDAIAIINRQGRAWGVARRQGDGDTRRFGSDAGQGGEHGVDIDRVQTSGPS